jgi:ATP-dependent Clp protease adaptor protein ClpS
MWRKCTIFTAIFPNQFLYLLKFLSFLLFIKVPALPLNFPKTKEEVLTIEELLEETVDGLAIVVFNDDVNTFEWVIESLMEVCKHSLEQAEQCALYIHFKGKYAVKHGTETELIPMKDALLDRGISAQIQ